jgi:hypothetical protein
LRPNLTIVPIKAAETFFIPARTARSSPARWSIDDHDLRRQNFVGWPCDEKEEDLRQQYIQETNPETQKALFEAMHRRRWEVIQYVPPSQLKQPFLWRKHISGVLKANTLVFWKSLSSVALLAVSQLCTIRSKLSGRSLAA